MFPVVLSFATLLCLLGAIPLPAYAHSDAAKFRAPVTVNHHHDEVVGPARLYPASVSIDPRQVVNVVIKINARIANLHNLYAGKRVVRGQVLGEIESAELQTVQATYLGLFSNMAAVQAISMTSDEKMVDARMNLLWRGMSEEDVKRLEATGHPLKRIKIKAPATGYLTSLNVVNNQILNAGSQGGQYATSGTTIATIAKPEAIVVEADMPASDAAALKPGQAATVYVTDPGKGRVAMPAQVQQIYAFVNPANQRQRVRLKMSATPARLGLLNGRVATVSFQKEAHVH